MSTFYPSLVQASAPAVEPLTVAEAVAHLKDPPSRDQEILPALITAARQEAEEFLGRALITQTWRAGWSRFPAEILLPKPRLQSVTTVKYFDTSNVEQTLVEGTDYLVDTASEPAVITPDVVTNTTWPSTDGRRNAVTVTYVTGYGDAETDVPEAIRRAMLLMVGDMFQHRESIGTGTIPYELARTPLQGLGFYRVKRFV